MYTTEERNYLMNHDLDLIEEYLIKHFKLKKKELKYRLEGNTILYYFKYNKPFDGIEEFKKAHAKLFENVLLISIDNFLKIGSEIKVTILYKSEVLNSIKCSKMKL